MFLNRPATLTPRLWAALVCFAAALPSSVPVLAQPVPAASVAPADLSPAERAKRDGDKVFHWILIHSDKPRKSAAPKDEAPTAAVRAKPMARAPAKAEEAVLKTEASSSASASVVAAAPGGQQGPSPMVEAAAPEPQAVASTVTVTPVLASLAVATAAPSVSAPVELADETLTPLARPEPEFPKSLMRTVHKGEVRVRFTVLPDGSVDAPAVVTTSHPRLNAAALAAIAQWRFVPLRKAQSAVVSLGFDLD